MLRTSSSSGIVGKLVTLAVRPDFFLADMPPAVKKNRTILTPTDNFYTYRKKLSMIYLTNHLR